MAEDPSRNRLDRCSSPRHNRCLDRLGGCYNSLTLDRVEALGEDLLDFTQMEDLTNWLDNDSLNETVR